MMGPAISPAVLGSAAVLAFRGISQSTCMPLLAARFYSATSLHNFRMRSQRDLPSKKQHIQAMKWPSSDGRGVHCYCTSTKESETYEYIEPTSQTHERQSTDIDRGIKIGNDKAMHGGEHTKEIHSNDSGSICHHVESVNEVEDEPIDRRALIELEVELLRQEAYTVPDTLNPAQWEELLSKPSRSARKKYLRFLFLNQMKKVNEQKKKELRRLEREKENETYNMSVNRYIAEDGHIQYGLWCNTIFLRIQESTVNHFNNGRVMSAMMHGQPIVIDVGFDEHMTSKERQNCANQLVTSFANNRTHPDPFYIHFCNAKKDTDTMQKLQRFIPTVYDSDFPLTVSPDSYLDNFPKEKLVYLTPHCNEEVTRFDHNAIYIIGGIVDLADSEPLTLAKARREGIRMQKLPLERYLNWGLGGKSLTINQTLNIMLDLKHTDDWYYSLRHIPKRKLKKFEDSQAQLQDYLRKNLRKSRHVYNPAAHRRAKSFYAD